MKKALIFLFIFFNLQVFAQNHVKLGLGNTISFFPYSDTKFGERQFLPFNGLNAEIKYNRISSKNFSLEIGLEYSAKGFRQMTRHEYFNNLLNETFNYNIYKIHKLNYLTMPISFAPIFNISENFSFKPGAGFYSSILLGIKNMEVVNLPYSEKTKFVNPNIDNLFRTYYANFDVGLNFSLEMVYKLKPFDLFFNTTYQYGFVPLVELPNDLLIEIDDDKSIYNSSLIFRTGILLNINRKVKPES